MSAGFAQWWEHLHDSQGGVSADVGQGMKDGAGEDDQFLHGIRHREFKTGVVDTQDIKGGSHLDSRWDKTLADNHRREW